jgi:hypothetical protein
MSAAAAKSASFFPDPPVDPLAAMPERDERGQRHTTVLAELTELGMKLARLVCEAAAGTGGEEAQTVVQRFGGGDPALAFSRISRAVRQTLLLEDHMAKDADTRAALDAMKAQNRREAIAKRAPALQQAYREALDKRITQVFARVLSAEMPAKRVVGQIDRLSALLDSEHEMAEILRYPPGEMVLRLARRLGVTIDWSQWADESWGAEILAAEGRPQATVHQATVHRLHEDRDDDHAHRGEERDPDGHPPGFTPPGFTPPSTTPPRPG